jgi:hypothetical protein
LSFLAAGGKQVSSISVIYDSDVATWHFGSWIHPENLSVEFDLIFFSPTKAGNYSLILFLTGLDGLVPSFMYVDFCTKLALQSNSIVVAYDVLKFVSLPKKEERLFEKTVNWTLSNINSLLNSTKTPDIIKNKVFADLNRFGVSLIGHSSGAHPLVTYLVKTCGFIKSLILIDPVDGYDPYGFVKEYITNPPEQLPVIIPTLVITTGLDSLPRSKFQSACAPANISNLRFYLSVIWINIR